MHPTWGGVNSCLARYRARVTARRIVLVRHAESEWNAAGRWQGWGDPPLSERGRQQAAALVAELAGVLSLDALVTSDLARAAETAAALGRGLGLVATPDARLRELRVGRWEGRTRQEIGRFDAAALARFDTGDAQARAGDGETLCELAARVRPAVAWHVGRAPAGCIGLVLHLGVLRTLLPGREDPPNAGWCEVAVDELELDPAAPLPLTAPAARA